MVFYSAGANLGLRLTFRANDILPNEPREPGNGILPRLLDKALRARVRRPFVMDTWSPEREVRIQVQLTDRVLAAGFERERLFSYPPSLSLMWICGNSCRKD